ncbi:MAG: hypothetical protein LBM96_00565 [Methanobrevibacter sp.]|jgi:hypothetical protein|nr:hypothetical protein [Candidatus Methanoflexus mossambicus]
MKNENKIKINTKSKDLSLTESNMLKLLKTSYGDNAKININYTISIQPENRAINENQNISEKEKKLKEIETITKNITRKNGAIEFYNENDSEGFADKFFIAKIPKDTTIEKRRKMKDKIIDELISIFKDTELFELFKNTSLFLRL